MVSEVADLAALLHSQGYMLYLLSHLQVNMGSMLWDCSNAGIKQCHSPVLAFLLNFCVLSSFDRCSLSKLTDRHVHGNMQQQQQQQQMSSILT